MPYFGAKLCQPSESSDFIIKMSLEGALKDGQNMYRYVLGGVSQVTEGCNWRLPGIIKVPLFVVTRR